MRLFRSLSDSISFLDMLSVDGAFSAAHVNYGKSPVFNGVSGKALAKGSRKGSISAQEKIENVYDSILSFNGTESGLKRGDRLELWRSYWFEYVNAFDRLVAVLPYSAVTVYVGRQAVEIGLKYTILCSSNDVPRGHDLGGLAKSLFSELSISEKYMEWVDTFCEKYCRYIEGGNPEYFRYPEYKANAFFAGNRLDVIWINYNFALILLKLIHFARLDGEFEEGCE